MPRVSITKFPVIVDHHARPGRDHRCRIDLLNDRRSIERRAGKQALALIDLCVDPAVGLGEVDLSDLDHRIGCIAVLVKTTQLADRGGAKRRYPGIDELDACVLKADRVAELLLMAGEELLDQLVDLRLIDRAIGDGDVQVAGLLVVLDVDRAPELDLLRGQAFAREHLTGLVL